MKIIIAPDSYKESLTAMEVATAIEAGFRQVLPDADYRKLPMADGGEGTVQALIDATGGTRIETTVTGPLGAPVQGFFGLLGDGSTAVIEMAAASGLHQVSPAQRNPLLTTSYGTGELIKAALDLDVGKILLGIGGSATNDGGIGMAQALGIRLLDRDGQDLGAGGAALARLATIDLRQLDPRLAAVTLEVACDVDNPLCGPTGASAVFGPQKGATPAMVAQLDANLAHYAAIIHSQLGRDVKDIPGAGAAGGLGAALLGLLDASLRPGIEIVTEAAGLADAVRDADWVITGEGRLDSQSIHGKTPVGVARIAKQFQRPVIAIAGSLAPDAHMVHQHGIDAVFSVVPGAMPLEQALAEAAANVETTARNIAALIQLQHLR
ncbi:glycerate kinase [Photobacterium sp. TY1-4]|uniref:glycerate kinase n=1 Tax=Photobacterium sp. TY1-4 TaxID=2899122 RepID=UPI0021C05DC0|nr:glycerate kinase [Photobacterium sp. TY1-4]UXI01665.1 glycerate kinase [Photobacterium sp. TY1-4]